MNLVAHSLGNLVAWETLRIHKRTSNSKLLNNITSVEPAIWWDAFEPQGPLTYNGAQDDFRTYTVDELKRNSWRFWFNGTGYWAGDAANDYFHCYNLGDFALNLEQINDMISREPMHYSRADGVWYRNPNNLYVKPVLMEVGQRFRDSSGLYYRDQLRKSAGTRDMSGIVTTSADVSGVANGWRPTAHADFKDRELPRVYQWYGKLLGGSKKAYPINKE